jgi:hypothetical protein
MLRDDEGAISARFHDGISDVGQIGDGSPVVEAIAAGALGAAFDYVAGYNTRR